MSDMICRKSMMRCQTPGMCSPHGGCRDEVTTAKDRQISALIAENERLKNRLEVDPRHDYDGISTRDATVKVLDEQVDQLKADNERLRADYAGLARFNPEWDRVAAAQDSVREHMAMVVQLKAEVAGLRTGYEAYEQVNAELKAENERLERNRDMWKGQVERQAEEMTALRKDADRYRWLRVKQTFIWLIQDWLPSNAVLTDVDAEIDAAMSKRAQSRAT